MTEHQLFINTTQVSGLALAKGLYADLPPDLHMEKALAENLRTVALHLQHSEEYGQPAPCIAGWRQTGLPEHGGWLEWRIDLRLGVGYLYDYTGDEYRVESLLTRRPSGNLNQVARQL